jgi:hypothetical protein
MKNGLFPCRQQVHLFILNAVHLQRKIVPRNCLPKRGEIGHQIQGKNTSLERNVKKKTLFLHVNIWGISLNYSNLFSIADTLHSQHETQIDVNVLRLHQGCRGPVRRVPPD